MGDLGSYKRAAQARKALLNCGARILNPDLDLDVSAHEAGHACAAWLLGLDPTRATIEPGDGFAGKVTYGRAAIDDRERAFDCATVSMAGNAAERLLGAPADCGQDDLRQARERLDTICRSEDDVDDMIDRAKRTARKMLRENAAALIKVTLALRTKRTLDADDIEEIMGSPYDSDDDDGGDGGMTLAEMMAAGGERGLRRLVQYRGDGGVI